MSRIYGIPAQSQYGMGFSRIGNFFAALVLGTLGSVIVVATLAGLSILRGFVLAQLWTWFLMPLGAPRIGIAHAVGISLLLTGLLTLPNKEEKTVWQNTLLTPFFILGIGYVVHLLM